ncbi:hypothetical protein GCM10022389_27740 [Flavobacterium cheonanense]|uniref:Secretion system C-terminal sorting domain-containing protein n=2 Tax=Flavobacterium cheonanense TaxID=706183 RepID=A0ABP7W511_9FLAO
MASAHCPAPTNVIAVDNTLLNSSIELSWTENGTASAWQVLILPNFNVGTQIPSFGWVMTSTNPFTIVGVPPSTQCYALFVRSACSLSNVSPWSAVGTSVCSLLTINYLATLSNDSFENNDTNRLTLFPNPTNNILKLNSNSPIDKVIISDFLCKVILVQTQGTNEINVESLSKGIYIVEVISGKDTFFSKFIKE